MASPREEIGERSPDTIAQDETATSRSGSLTVPPVPQASLIDVAQLPQAQLNSLIIRTLANLQQPNPGATESFTNAGLLTAPLSGTLAHSPQRAQARLGEMPGEALLAHVPVATQTAGVPPTLPGPLPSALGQPPQLPLTIPTSASDPTTWRLCSCDTGELLPAKLVAKITASQFMELHEFLPKPLLEAAQPRSTNSCTCCQASNTPPRAQKTIADIFTWLLCYHRYAAAVASIAPQRVPGMLAHANNIIQAAQQFEGDGWRVYDRAFRLQAAASVTQDWGTMNIPLYARTFMGASARRFVCRFCCSREHQSHQCPWGVDTPSLRPATNRPAPARPVSLGESVTPTCTSWNAGACRFPTSCRYRHVCSNCGEQHPRTACRNPLPTVPEAKRPAIR